jgi:hypothetical protein
MKQFWMYLDTLRKTNPKLYTAIWTGIGFLLLIVIPIFAWYKYAYEMAFIQSFGILGYVLLWLHRYFTMEQRTTFKTILVVVGAVITLATIVFGWFALPHREPLKEHFGSHVAVREAETW